MSREPGGAMVGLVWAQARGGVIGAANAIPWHVPEDVAHFKEVTAKHPVVMGRRTWDSLPERFRPLPGRRNIVVTRQGAWEADGAERAGSLEQALELAAAPAAASEPHDHSTPPAPPQVWVMGGGELYRQAMAVADRLEVTEIDLDVDGEAFAPDCSGDEWRVDAREPAEGWLESRKGLRYRFLTLVRRPGSH